MITRFFYICLRFVPDICNSFLPIPVSSLRIYNTFKIRSEQRVYKTSSSCPCPQSPLVPLPEGNQDEVERSCIPWEIRSAHGNNLPRVNWKQSWPSLSQLKAFHLQALEYLGPSSILPIFFQSQMTASQLRLILPWGFSWPVPSAWAVFPQVCVASSFLKHYLLGEHTQPSQASHPPWQKAFCVLPSNLYHK